MEGRQNGWIKYARPNTLAYFGAVLVAKCKKKVLNFDPRLT
jgi:hypothetical protein